MNHLSPLRIARFGSNAEEPSIARTHWCLAGAEITRDLRESP